MYGFDNLTNNTDAANWVDDIDTTKALYYFFDLGCSSFIVLWIFVFKVYANITKKKIRSTMTYTK